jgi:hypothetical protein
MRRSRRRLEFLSKLDSNLEAFDLVEPFIRHWAITGFPEYLRDRQRLLNTALANERYYKDRGHAVIAHTRVLLTATPAIAVFVLGLMGPVFAIASVEYCGQPVPWHAKIVAWQEFDSVDSALNSLDKETRDGLIFLIKPRHPAQGGA